MAIRTIKIDGDEILRKKSRPVNEITDRIRTMIDDMAETMYESRGVGLAAPQVGILKRIVVIDIGEGLIELINPEIVATEGQQEEMEGCLSVPDVWGIVKRPQKVTVKALNKNGDEIVIVGENILAIALAHEIDHLDGILFTDKVIRYVDLDEIREQGANKS